VVQLLNKKVRHCLYETFGLNQNQRLVWLGMLKLKKPFFSVNYLGDTASNKIATNEQGFAAVGEIAFRPPGNRCPILF
jgi:hypothetical protein